MKSDDLKELLAKNRISKVLDILNKRIKNFIKENPESHDFDIFIGLQKTLIVNSSLYEKLKNREINNISNENDEIAENKITRNLFTIIEDLPDRFWRDYEIVREPPIINLNITILSRDHFHNPQIFIEYLNNQKNINIQNIERHSIPDLGSSNLILIDSDFRDTAIKTKALIEKIREFHPAIVFVLLGSKYKLDEFINKTEDRFKHYYQIREEEDQNITIDNFKLIVDKISMEIFKKSNEAKIKYP